MCSAQQGEDPEGKAAEHRIGGGPTSFAAGLPPVARECLAAWQAARKLRSPGRLLPDLGAFAPMNLPRRVLPWILIHRERGDGEFVYGLAGEELAHYFGKYPIGERVLGYAEPRERAARIEVIRTALETGRAVWFTGSLLFEHRDAIPVGRLGLPALSGPANARERVLLLVYFLLRAFPEERARDIGRIVFDPRDVIWCTDAEADGAVS